MVFRVYILLLDFDSIASRFVYIRLNLYSRSRIIFKNRSHAVSYSAISSAEASGSTSSYGGNSEFDSSEFAVRYTDNQETEERLDVDETDI